MLKACDVQVVFLLCAPVQFYVGREFYVAAARALRYGSSTMDVLVVLGTTSGFLYSILSVVLACWAGGEAKHFFETSGMVKGLAKGAPLPRMRGIKDVYDPQKRRVRTSKEPC